jgi:hypothetical protein
VRVRRIPRTATKYLDPLSPHLGLSTSRLEGEEDFPHSPRSVRQIFPHLDLPTSRFEGEEDESGQTCAAGLPEEKPPRLQQAKQPLIPPVIVKRGFSDPIPQFPDELWQNAAILLDKPSGWTSFDICAKLRGVLRMRKVKLPPSPLKPPPHLPSLVKNWQK